MTDSGFFRSLKETPPIFHNDQVLIKFITFSSQKSSGTKI